MSFISFCEYFLIFPCDIIFQVKKIYTLIYFDDFLLFSFCTTQTYLFIDFLFIF